MPSRKLSRPPRVSRARPAPSTWTPTATPKNPSSSSRSRGASSPTTPWSKGAKELSMLEAVGRAIVTGLAQGAMIALVALGYTMVYGILKLINFAHSEVFMMAAYAGFFALTALGGKEHPVLAATLGTLFAMGAAATLGILVERTAYRPLRNRAKKRGTGTSGAARVTPLVTALGVSVLLQNLAQLLFTARYRSYPQLFSH